jgi:hypothetical protein
MVSAESQTGLDDGRSYEGRDPEMAIVPLRSLPSAYQDATVLAWLKRIRHCSIAHIVEAEPMDESKPPRRKRST